MYYVVSRLRDKQGGLERFPFAITDSEELVSQINFEVSWETENIDKIKLPIIREL
jgi:hypothetical protein